MFCPCQDNLAVMKTQTAPKFTRELADHLITLDVFFHRMTLCITLPSKPVDQNLHAPILKKIVFYRRNFLTSAWPAWQNDVSTPIQRVRLERRYNATKVSLIGACHS